MNWTVLTTSDEPQDIDDAIIKAKEADKIWNSKKHNNKGKYQNYAPHRRDNL